MLFLLRSSLRFGLAGFLLMNVTTDAASQGQPVAKWEFQREVKRGTVSLSPDGRAEALARLDANRPPGDVPPRRWLRFIDDEPKPSTKY
jgi:hypothetical protein